MKKLSVLLTFTLLASLAIAQKGKVNTALSYFNSGKLDKAKEFIDLGIKHPKCADYDKAYFVKGQIYQGIFESPLPAYKNLDKNALYVAYDAFKKVIELDVKKNYTKKLLNQYTNLALDFTNQAVKKYNDSDFAGALEDFKLVLKIEGSDIMKEKNIIDTAVIFNAGMAAQKAGKLEEAVNFYKEALKYNYGEAKTYAFLANCLKELKQEEESLKFLHKGYELYPDNTYMLVELINYYLLGGEPEKAEKYLDAAISQDPGNASFYRAKGTLYEKTQKLEEAIKMYEKALELDPKDFNSQYNLGLIHLNKVSQVHKKVNDIMDVDEYNKEIKKVFAMYKEVIPYFTKAHQLDPKEKNTIITLKELYFRLRNESAEYMDLYKKYKEMADGAEGK